MCVCVCVCVCFQISSLKPLGQLKPNLIWNLHRTGEENLFKWSRSFVVLFYCQPPGGGAFNRDFTINLSPQCRTFSRALKNERLKAPLFPGPYGTGTTNDWCIITAFFLLQTWVIIRHISTEIDSLFRISITQTLGSPLALGILFLERRLWYAEKLYVTLWY